MINTLQGNVSMDTRCHLWQISQLMRKTNICATMALFFSCCNLISQPNTKCQTSVVLLLAQGNADWPTLKEHWFDVSCLQGDCLNWNSWFQITWFIINIRKTIDMYNSLRSLGTIVDVLLQCRPILTRTSHYQIIYIVYRSNQ